MGTIEATINAKLQRALHPEYLEVINESGKHNVPPGSESHFKVTVVASAFEGNELIERHREVNRALSDEFASVHALSLHTLTPDEWRERGGAAHATPPCLGGSKSNA